MKVRMPAMEAVMERGESLRVDIGGVLKRELVERKAKVTGLKRT